MRHLEASLRTTSTALDVSPAAGPGTAAASPPQYLRSADRIVPLPGRGYLPYVLALIDRAQRSVLATVFIIDPRVETDFGGNVRLLLDSLARARWRGVDTRVIVGSSRQTPAIELADRVARRYLEGLGVPCRPYASSQTSGTLHSKYLVVDETIVVVGSHNWSHQALCLDDELSLAVESKDLTLDLQTIFEGEWARASSGEPAAEKAAPALRDSASPSARDEEGGAGRRLPSSKTGGLRATLEQALGTWAATWHPSLAFDPARAATLRSALYELATLAGGEPLDVEPVTDPASLAAYAVAAADQGLRRHFKGLAETIADPDGRPLCWVEDARDKLGGATNAPPGGPSFVLRTRRPRVNLALAGEAELRSLPGIGPVLASRITGFRQAGSLDRPEDLDGVKGIGPVRLRALGERVCHVPGLPAAATPSRWKAAFHGYPEVRTYVAMVRADAVPDPAGVVLAQVQQAVAVLSAEPAPGGGGRPALPERAAYVGRLRRRVAGLRPIINAPGPAPEAWPGLSDPAAAPFPARPTGRRRGAIAWAGLVSRSAYLDVALRLIRSAERDVKLVMFFMSYRTGRPLPTNVLVEELAAARRRGCRVRVVLDLDQPDDPYGSRHVNRAAYRYLESQGVDVTWDDREWVTHTKLLVVDGRDVLCGSHNWTAGSLRDYDDQSLVIRSRALAASLTGKQGVTALARPRSRRT